MPSIEWPLAGDVMVFHLAQERERTSSAAGASRRGPSFAATKP